MPFMSMNSLCPITRSKGRLLRTRQPEELFSSYEQYLGAPLPQEFYSLYFKEAIQEYESDLSGLRWYTPSRIHGIIILDHGTNGRRWSLFSNLGP